MSSTRYQRVLLKLSGESVAGNTGYGIDGATLEYLTQEIQMLCRLGVEVAVVIGGGNIFRGIEGQSRGIDRASGDYMGMLATVINSIALQETLEAMGIAAQIQTAFTMQPVAELFVRKQALQYLEAGKVLILAAGTGHPFFTTDTAAVLRAVEIEADVILKATKVDGVYTADPVTDPTAQRFEQITYFEVLQQQLRVMDLTAISLCMEHQIPIVVFDVKQPGNMQRILLGEPVGTLVSHDANK